MTTRNYHTPPQPGSTRAKCPVCHEAVYSRAGIHPQCAVRQSDPPRPKNAAPTAVADPDSVTDVDGDVEAEVEVDVEIDSEIETATEPVAVVAPAVAAKRRRS